MYETLIPVACFFAGCFAGAWLYSRGQVGRSPLPMLPAAWTEPKDEKPVEPRVKP